jgi:signal transduction histidine kinase
LIIAPAVLALVLLGGAVLATGRASADTVVAAVALLLVVVFGLLGAQSVLGALTRLRDSSLTAANRVLPERIERLREPRELGDRTPEELVRDVADPVNVDVHDELGQVAYAVNTMYREALRSAAEQARQRGEVNTMVFSLARRSQALVDKMAGVLREIERAETDPERLTRLFELDRLATRMRRNDENMLILAGVDSTPPRDTYMLLTELVEAAQGEVEQHGRVDPGTVDDDVAVAAPAAGDVVRLIAELIDNATRFSAPSTAVLVDGRRIGDYVLIEIEDRGLGMSPSVLEGYNQRLAAPPPADVSDCRMMGLAVVARLAERHQIRVTLRANADSGTVASVTLPTALLVLPQRHFDRALPRPRMPELPAAAPPGWPLAGTPTAGRPAHQGVLPGGPGALPARTHALPAGPSRPSGDRWALPAGTPAHAAGDHLRPAAHASGNGTLPRHSELGPALALPSGDGRGGLALPDGNGRVPDGGPVVGDGDEPVIFKEMQARWFGVPQPPRTDPPQAAVPAAEPVGTGWPLGAAPGRTGQPGTAAVAGNAVAGHSGTAGSPGTAGNSGVAGKESPDFMDDEYGWRSAADDGWRAASAAAQPRSAGTTDSGLPRRRPAAQLVPGAVPAEAPAGRRDPDEVRGTLAAYHRGVQRGRGGGEAQSSGHPRSADEEMH